MPENVERNPLSLGQELTLAWSRTAFGLAASTLTWFRAEKSGDWVEHVYGSHPDERLDTLTPHHESECGVIIFIHGGGWVIGDKEFYSADLEYFVAAGYSVFNVEYPKAPGHPHPHILRSVVKALAWIKQRTSTEGVHLMGDSAGGNLAVMASLLIENPKLRDTLGTDFDFPDTPAPLSCISLYGILDRRICLSGGVPGGEAVIAAYGGAAALEDTVDLGHSITPMDLDFDTHAPCFLAVGSDDAVLGSSELYHARLQDQGHKVTFNVYRGAGHGFLSFPQSQKRQALLKDIETFLKSVDKR